MRTTLRQPGFTLIDSILSLSVVAIMIVIYASLVNVHAVSRRVAFRAQAAILADQEINALKQLDASTLANQTNGSFQNVLYNAGAWKISTDAANLDTTSSPCPPATSGKHCGANVLELLGSSGYTGQPSGRLLFPAGAYGAATLQANWQVVSDSPSGWAIGYWLQASDKNNTYRVRLAAATTDLDSGTSGTQNLVLEKVSAGTTTVLFSKSNVSFPLNSWNTLKVVMDPTASATLKIYINGTQQDTGTITDAAFTSGPAALLTWGGVHVKVDDVTTTTDTTQTWDFEGNTNLPVDWIRLSLNALPDGTGTFDDNGLLTISPYPTSTSTTLKQVLVTIQWLAGGTTVSYTTTSLIGKSGVGL